MSNPSLSFFSSAWPLLDRALLRVTGPDTRSFLQGLITQDVLKLQPGHAVYSCLLTPQGRFLYDLFIYAEEGGFLLEVEGGPRLHALLNLLNTFRLRSQVTFEDVSAQYMPLFFPHNTLTHTHHFPKSICFQDPRLPGFGTRYWLHQEDRIASKFPPVAQAKEAATNAITSYLLHRLNWGVPEGSLDLDVGKSIPLEFNLDELQAFHWQKGCYMGQELMARTKHRGLLRKRVFPFQTSSPLHTGTLLLHNDQDAGKIVSAYDTRGFALIRLEHLSLTTDALVLRTENLSRDVTIHIPAWLQPSLLTASNP